MAIFCEWNEDGYLTVKNMPHICVGHEQDSVHKLALSCLVMRIYVFGLVKKGTFKLLLTDILCHAFFFFQNRKPLFNM